MGFEEWWKSAKGQEAWTGTGFDHGWQGVARTAWTAAQAECQGGWVSAEERLPEGDTLVLTYAPDGDNPYFRMETARMASGRFWTNSHLVPTHWRPLPAPPQQAAHDPAER